MANDGQIVFEVTADGKHAIADIKEITRAIQNESKNWDKAADESTNHIANSFSSMLKKLVGGFSAIKIGKALIDIGKDAVQAASDLQEVQNVVDVTFGEGASKTVHVNVGRNDEVKRVGGIANHGNVNRPCGFGGRHGVILQP